MSEENEFKNKILKNTPENFKDSVTKAIQYVSEVHKEDKRYNGESLLSHLLKVAYLTTQIGLDLSLIHI